MWSRIFIAERQLTLARSFKAGSDTHYPFFIAERGLKTFQSSLMGRRQTILNSFPALKRRAKVSRRSAPKE